MLPSLSRRAVALLLVLASLAGAPAGAQSSSSCVVERVTDGDTFRCTDDQRVRLLLIDAPETSQKPFGAHAKRALAALIPVGTTVRLEHDVQPKDRYGRTLAYVYTPAGQLVNEALLVAGYADVAVYPPNVRHVERFRAAKRAAQTARRGLWATDGFACSPADHRRHRC